MPPPGGVLPYIGYIGMCGAKGYVWNRVSISTILVWIRVWFVHSSLELGMFFFDKSISLLLFTPTVYVL